MAYTLKINIYNFSLYRITKTIERMTRVGIRVSYETEPNAVAFNEVVGSINANLDRSNYLPTLFQSLVAFFDQRFKTNDEGTKAVSITTDPTPSYNSIGYVINGLFKGGDTGIVKTVYSQQDAAQPGIRISNTDVPSNNFFYKIWMPYDGEDGVLMIQSYTDMGCTATFREQLEQFFISIGYRPKWNTMIPSGFIDQYLDNSFIKNIKVIYATEQRRENGVFATLANVKREGWLKNLRIPFNQLFGLDDYKERLQEKIMEYIDYDQYHDMVKVFYVDADGKKASASLNNLENILPNIILPNTLKDVDTEEPLLSEISIYTDGILEQIKVQIGYTAYELQ